MGSLSWPELSAELVLAFEVRSDVSTWCDEVDVRLELLDAVGVVLAAVSPDEPSSVGDGANDSGDSLHELTMTTLSKATLRNDFMSHLL